MEISAKFQERAEGKLGIARGETGEARKIGCNVMWRISCKASREESWTWAGHCEHLVPEEKNIHWTALKKYYPLLLTSVNSTLQAALGHFDNADKKTLFRKIVIVRRKKYLYKSNQCHWLVMSHRLGGSWHAMQWCSNHISFLYTRSTFDHSTSNKLSGVRIVFRAASSPFLYDWIVEQWHILQIENLRPQIGYNWVPVRGIRSKFQGQNRPDWATKTALEKSLESLSSMHRKHETSETIPATFAGAC